jgi:hypothetical protein
MAKITRTEKPSNRVIQAKTVSKKDKTPQGYKWWLANSKRELTEQVLETVAFLKTQQQYRYRQAGIFAKLYGNQPLYSFAGSNIGKIAGSQQNLPIDRPTMNVIQSCIDTLVSRITQARPRPLFLTDNGDYKHRKLAKQMNSFINGELYQTGAYDIAEQILRDACIFGTGVVKICETDDHKVKLERRLLTELFVDPNDGMYGFPRGLFEVKLVDRSVLKELFPQYKSDIEKAESAFPDNMSDSSRSVADQVIVAEAWHLPSSKNAGDGRHSIVCSQGPIEDEEYTKDKFPFEFFHYAPRPLGFWAQGLAEQLMGTQTQINEMLITASRSINLLGVPRVWLEQGSKVSKATFNNAIGMIGTYTGTLPTIMEGHTGLGADYYEHLQRLIQYAYQQSGISALAATSQKPAGLNSGEAIRNYDDLQTDRFSTLSKRYENLFSNISYQCVDKAIDIAEREGSYQTIYPNKNGTQEIDLPEMKELENPFVIQCFETSSLPRDPAGRQARIAEDMQAGLLTPEEGRRLRDYPDLEQVDNLQNAGEERILKILDQIVEEGKYTGPDPFMNLLLAEQLCTQYYNLYVPAKLEEKRAQYLRDFFSQIQSFKQAMQPPPQLPMMGTTPQALPEAPPVSGLIPNMPTQ